MAKSSLKTGQPRRRKPHSAAYWALFVICSLLSFAGGFWFTFRTTQVTTKEPLSTVTAAPLTQEATDSLPGQDPYAPIPGPTVSPTPIDPFAVGPEGTPTPEPTRVREIAPSLDPSPTAAPTRRPDRAAGKSWRVQVGTYETESDAQAMVDELAAAGITAAAIQDEDGLYHAQIGEFRDRDAALRACDDVYARGYSASIR